MPAPSKYGESVTTFRADIPKSLWEWMIAFLDDINENHLRVRRVHRTDAMVALMLFARDNEEEFRRLIIEG